MTKKVVLLLEDDESIQLVTSDFLLSEGYIVKASKTIKSLWKMYILRRNKNEKQGIYCLVIA